MPRRRHHRRDSEDHPNPLIIQRDPESYDPYSRRHHETILITEQTIRRHRGGREERLSNTTLRPRRSRNSSSPPPPPIISQRNIRTVSPPSSTSPPSPPPPPPPSIPTRRVRIASLPVRPILRRTMSPKPTDRGFVPLPPKIPTPEEPGREPKSGRQSQQSHRSREEEYVDVEPSSSRRRRSPRPYHRHAPSDPYREQEEILDSRPRDDPEEERYEIVRPYEPVRSRQRQNDVRLSREYREMKQAKEDAEARLRIAEDANQHYSTVEARLQAVKEQLDIMTQREARSNEKQGRLERELEEARREKEHAQRELELCRRHRQADAVENDLERRPREGRGGSRVVPRPQVHQSDMTPRTITRAPAEDDDPARAYITQAQHDAKRRGRT